MDSKDDDAPLDPQLVAAISIPRDSRIPDPRDGRSTTGEYDLYFHILRDNPGLLEWTRTCVNTLDAQLADLGTVPFTPEERCQVLEGMLLVFQATLRKWLASGEVVQERPRA